MSTTSLRNVIEQAFNPTSYDYSRSTVGGKYSLVIRPKKEGFFLPNAINIFAINRLINSDIYNREILVPLSNNASTIKKTTNSILNASFTHSFHRGLLMHVDTGKGYSYYGCKGLLLDSDYKPLILCGSEIVEATGVFSPKKPVCYISPSVFSREDMISKYIVRHIIPYLTKYRAAQQILLNEEGRTYHSFSYVDIIISYNINEFFHKVVPPLNIEAEKDMYKLLERGFDTDDNRGVF